MQDTRTSRIRLGAFALGLTGVITTVALLAVNTQLDIEDGSDLTAAAQALSSSGYQMWAGLMIFSNLVAILGWLGLYLYLSKGRGEKLAFWGMLLTILGVAMNLPGWGVWSYAGPVGGQQYLGGVKDALTVYRAIDNSQGIYVSYASLVVLAIGLILLAVAVFQDGTLPKPAMIVLVITNTILGPFYPAIVAIIIAAVMALAGLWLAYTIFQKAGQTPQVSEPVSYQQPVANQAGR
jgi:hypothetical protein